MNNSILNGSNRWAALGVIIMGTFMAILDVSIVNVALPHMMSTFGVNREKIEWVSTAFMLSTAVAMPLVGWMVGKLGHKRLYLSSLALFTVGSALCAVSWSYESLIAARVIQAVGGGAIQPVGMAIIADLFEPHERGKALGVWGTGIMLGPAIGPTLGGYLTEWFNWRSIFSVNLPVGALTFLAGMLLIRRVSGKVHQSRSFDWWGYVFLSMTLISGLLALSQGQDKGWTSGYILTCLALSFVGIVMFLGVESSVSTPLLNLKLFLYRNFTLSMILALCRAIGMFGSVFLFPIFLQNLMGYTTIQTGVRMMPGAVAVGLMMIISGRLTDRYSPRVLASIGVVVTGCSMFMWGGLDPLSSSTVLIGPQIFRGVGMALMMTPLMAAALNAVPKTEVATASSFLNVAQQVGGSFGIAILNSFVTNSAHEHAVRLGDMTATASATFQRLSSQLAGLSVPPANGVWLTDKTFSAYVGAQAITKKASVMGFDNGFVLAGLIILMGLPLCLMLQNIKRANAAPVVHGEQNNQAS